MSSDIKSMQVLCLEVITKNFSRYIEAFNSTEDNTLKRNLCFLQRVHTRTLFSALEQNNELKGEHFDFLLNEHLKNLNLGTLLRYSSKELILEKVIPIAHSLCELSCHSDYRYEEDSMFIFEKLIPLCNNITKICIPCCNDNLMLLIGSNCSHLLELSIEKTINVTSDGIKALCLDSNGQIKAKCPLKLLDLSCIVGTELSIEDVAFLLKNMPTLQEVLYPKLPEVIESIHQLDIDNNVVSDTKHFNLISLDFMPYDSVQLTKLLTLCSERCPKLKKLSVPIFLEQEIDIIFGFSNLEDLTIISFGEADVLDLDKFLTKKGNNLKNLTIDSFSFSVSTLIESCPTLESLTLKNIVYKELNMNSTKLLNRLHDLHLESIIFLDYHCTDSMMMLLNSSPILESLSLHYCDFSESEIVAKLSTFSLNCKLTHLQFDCCDVGVDLLLQFIMNCNSIKTLSLDGCENISSDDIYMLNQTVEASNRKIGINFIDDPSNLANSDDAEFEGSDYDFYDDEDEYNDYEDYEDFDDYEDYDDYDQRFIGFL